MSSKVHATSEPTGGGENPPGLTDNVTDLAETSDEALKRILLPNERIVSQFDCYFPGGMIPVWKMVYLCVITVGLYGIVLLYRAYLRMCYRMRCMTPALIEFNRGKLGVTNKGRLICWTESVSQVKQPSQSGMLMCLCNFLLLPIKCCFRDTCGAPVKYNIHTKTRVYNASAIRQVSQYYRSKALCLMCCVEYECGIEVSLGEFNFSSDDVSITATSHSAAHYYFFLSSLVGSTINAFEDMVGGTQGNKLNVISNTFDRHHNGDIHSVLEDLAVLHGALVAALPPGKDSFCKNPDIVFGAQGKMQKVDGFTGVTIVQDNRTIQIPPKWFPLLPGEEILATNGEVFQMNYWKWFLSIITLGHYYCKHVRALKFDRSALILTNKRVVDMDIYQRSGTVPTHLSNFSVKVRSYFPGDVTSGYISSVDRKNLTTSILCEGGQLLLSFPSGRDALPFARALQMSSFRARNQVPITRANDSTSTIKDDDFKILPLLPGETIISSVDGERSWLPFCAEKYTLRWVNWFRATHFCSRPAANACSKEVCGCCFPWLPYVFTCALRPFQNHDDLIVTGTSLLRYTRARNWRVKDKFLVSWVPLIDIIGQNLTVISVGDEKFLTRCCRNNCLGATLCPVGKSTYTFDVDMKKVSFGVSGEAVNHNWSKDPKVTRLTDMLGTLQVAIEEMKRGGDSAV